jgi:hypothetical protein
MTPSSPTPAPGELHPASPLAPTGASEPAPLVRPGRALVRLGTIFIGAFALCAIAYLAIAIPGKWFADAPPLAWGAKDLQIAKGSGRVVADELHVRPADATGLAVVSVKRSIKATNYAAIEWIAIDVPEHIDVSLLWRTDYKPEQLNSIPLVVVTGRLLRVVTKDHPAWIGNIDGIALAMRGPIAEPVRIRGVVAKSMSAREVASDRVREWFAFEEWNGTSINTVTGGADLQDMPLPVLLAATVGIAVLILLALRRWRPSALPSGMFVSVVAIALAAWLVLDARWMWNLVRQVDATADRFGGKSWTDKRLAVEDGPLFAFMQKAKEAMPDTPVRVFVAADSAYFRGRAAYHLYPHNAYAPRANVLPEPAQVKPGDWIAVYLRKGVQYDPAQGKLRWDNREPVSAELKLSGRGAALFVIR